MRATNENALGHSSPRNSFNCLFSRAKPLHLVPSSKNVDSTTTRVRQRSSLLASHHHLGSCSRFLPFLRCIPATKGNAECLIKHVSTSKKRAFSVPRRPIPGVMNALETISDIESRPQSSTPRQICSTTRYKLPYALHVMSNVYGF